MLMFIGLIDTRLEALRVPYMLTGSMAMTMIPQFDGFGYSVCHFTLAP
jgi:hypothetical protein